ncbi:MAG: UDP-glucose 4-epimerase GalE [Candidatus Kapabacteria bacterium]|nr:UDP-glucose 4-epimerase GalE [Ignavibacteriota bacterium]MCW5885674.1 UDP-glucose 4-epimerase GalE [Candidatus Kapabacteria bacterium]
MAKVLVTGGTGYIGSHTAIELIGLNHDVVIIDNLANSEIKTLDRIEKITGIRPIFYNADVTDFEQLNQIFTDNPDIHSVIHFAAYKAVGESVNFPLMYYTNNIGGLLSLIKVMEKFKCKNLIFSSSCTVYGQPDILPVSETTPLQPANSPYGNTKKVCEDIIKDYIESGKEMRAILLRYFNPVGAHPCGLIGELPQGIPNNLMPFITQTALGLREKLMVFGNDYNTPDGTAIRDYIHVSDLADAHIKAIEYLDSKPDNFLDIFNVGTGEGFSVLQVIESINKVLDKPLPYQIVDRRAGDIEKIWADSTKANNFLNWKPKYNLDDMTATSYKWELNLRADS